jgi:hypothetical protein
MIQPGLDINKAIAEKIIDPSNNPRPREDYRKVTSFLQLKGRPSRPIDERIAVREPADFARVRRKLPKEFFEPFNWLLKLADRPALQVEPDDASIKLWNQPEFVPRLVGDICRLLDAGDNSLLVPKLVAAFLNLERERQPSKADWATISVIAVPGSRTYDRAAEAFRAYLRTQGKAVIVCSGKSPYYDPDNENVQLTESEANACYLRLLGVPGDRICVESTSRDTSENVQFLPDAISQLEVAKGIQFKSILLVTSPFHLTRYRLGVEQILNSSGDNAKKIFAIGSKASRYWAETYFLADAKSGYTHEATMGVVFNEYLKIAFDLCIRERIGQKLIAPR